MAVHKALGKGFVEGVYGDCLAIEFEKRGIPFVREPEMHIMYDNRVIHHTFKPDFVCYDRIIVELKAVNDIIPDHEAQIINYLYVSKMRLGLLINFGNPYLWYKRYPNLKEGRIAQPGDSSDMSLEESQ